MVWVDGAAVGAASSAIRDGLAALSAIIVAEFETRGPMYDALDELHAFIAAGAAAPAEGATAAMGVLRDGFIVVAQLASARLGILEALAASLDELENLVPAPAVDGDQRRRSMGLALRRLRADCRRVARTVRAGQAA
jgi:hypothetical protein